MWTKEGSSSNFEKFLLYKHSVVLYKNIKICSVKSLVYKFLIWSEAMSSLPGDQSHLRHLKDHVLSFWDSHHTSLAKPLCFLVPCFQTIEHSLPSPTLDKDPPNSKRNKARNIKLNKHSVACTMVLRTC